MAKRGPYAKGRERREEILEATLEVFSRSGYRGASMRAIARQIDITPTLIQHYFPTKEDLLTEVIRAWDDENARLSGNLPMIDAFLFNIRRNMGIPGLIHLYTAYAVEASDPDHPARAFFAGRYAVMTDDFVHDLDRRKRAGTAPRDLDPVSTARVIIATCEGMQIRWLHSPDFDMYDEFWAFLGTLGLEPYASQPPLRLAGGQDPAVQPHIVE